MTTARLLLLMIPLTGSLLLGGDSAPKGEKILWGDADGGLRLGLSAPKEKVELGEPVAFSVLIEATDADKTVPNPYHPLYVFCFSVQDETKKEVGFTRMGKGMLSVAGTGSEHATATVPIAKGMQHRLVIHDLARVFDLSLPGRYRIQVSSQGGAWPKAADGTRVSLTSGVLEILVEESRKLSWFGYEQGSPKSTMDR